MRTTPISRRISVRQMDELEPIFTAEYATKIIIATLASDPKYTHKAARIAEALPTEGRAILRIEKSDLGDRLKRSLEDFTADELEALNSKLIAALFNESPVWAKRVRIVFE